MPVSRTWAAGVARWRRFVEWLRPSPSGHWLDVGCGTGALASAICDLCEPSSVVACDMSEPFVEHARRTSSDARLSFVVAGADALDEGRRFPVCRSGALASAFEDAGLQQVAGGSLEIPTVFATFEDGIFR